MAHEVSHPSAFLFFPLVFLRTSASDFFRYLACAKPLTRIFPQERDDFSFPIKIRQILYSAIWVSRSSSAICTAFNAAPLRRLSETTQRCKPCGTVGSRRMREM